MEKETISIEDFKKLEIKIGKILSAEKVPDTDKLLKLSVDMGLKPRIGSPDPETNEVRLDLGEERDIRQIISGISKYFPNPEELVGKKCAFASNLEKRVIKGLESQGMILAVNGPSSEADEKEFFSLLLVGDDVLPGSTVK